MGKTGFVYYPHTAIILLLLYAACNFYCITRLSVTGDEANYYNYGINILKNRPQKELLNGVPEYNSQLPIIALNALSRAIPQLFHPGMKHSFQQTLMDVTAGRIFSVLSALALALFVLVWSTKLYGQKAGIFSLVLYTLCPNILAHSQLVGTDVYSFLLCTATSYYAWQFNRLKQVRYLLLAAVALGIGQITKQSLLLLYPVIVFFLGMSLYQSCMPFSKKVCLFARQIIVILLVSGIIINAGFLFYKTGKPAGEYHFVSAKFKSLQQQFSFAGKIPLPLPEPYVAGFDYVAFNAETPPGINGLSSYGSGYFLGQPVTGKLIWYYYAVCFFFKLPIPFMLFFFASLMAYFINRSKFHFIQNEIFLLLPAAFIFILFSLFNPMYLGIKNLLLVLPLLFIFCGSLLNNFILLKCKLTVIITGSLLLWELVSVGAYFPHFLPYTNEFITNKKNAYKVLGDANIYFQEGRLLANQYLNKHPDIQFEPEKKTTGKVMVSLETYFDYWHEGKMQWLRDLHIEPTGHFDSQYLIFTVP